MSKTEWKEYRLGEVTDSCLGKMLDAKKNRGTPQPYLANVNVRWGSFDLDDLPLMHFEESESERYGLKFGDIVVCEGGEPGRCAIWKDQVPNMKIQKALHRVRCHENVDYRFLYYYLLWAGKKGLFDQYCTGSTIKHLPGEKLKILPIRIPPLAEQQRIAKILSSLDDKIELNNAINRNLEEQAQAIFKSWFVDFEPFGGKMPIDWETGSLSDIADYLNGLAMQKFRPKDDEIGLPVLKIKELRQGFAGEDAELCSPGIKSEYIVNDGDVIFSWSGSLLVDLWCGGKCGLNQHLFKVTSKEYDKWFYYMWTKHHLDRFIFLAADKATTMCHIKREELDKAEVCIPSKSDYDKIESSLKPIIETIIEKKVENRHLITLRDELLPKLMDNEQYFVSEQQSKL